MESIGADAAFMAAAAGKAFITLMEPHRLMFLMLGCMMGLVLGIVPGIGGLAGTAMLLPFTFGMDPYSAFALLLGLGATTATGDPIPAILFGVPGGAASAATVLDGFPMAKKGEAGRALSAAYMSSLMGGIFGAMLLAISIPILRPVMLYLGSPELLAFSVLGISMVAVLSGSAPLRGVAAGCLGIMIAMIGSDPQTGTLRWTMDSLYLWDGLPLTPVLLGLFALPERWIATQFRGARFTLAPASEDASFRRYFRATFDDGRTLIAMDAPPDKEDCRPFVHVAALLKKAGVHAPEVQAQDLDAGFLLLSDLGTRTYLAELNEASADRLFADATDALIAWQRASRPGELPAYDEALLRRELNLFPEWYVKRHRGIDLNGAQAQALESVFAQLVRSALAQPTVYVHRDYMPRNLMVSEPNPGVLDFQDAVMGPITYDVVSLMRDAFLSWQEERVLDWTVRYWQKAKSAGLPVDADFGEFWRAFEWMGLQRHLKVLGIFARINYRDGKPKYLGDTPRFIAYARPVAKRYRDLAPLLNLLDEIEK